MGGVKTVVSQGPKCCRLTEIDCTDEFRLSAPTDMEKSAWLPIIWSTAIWLYFHGILDVMLANDHPPALAKRSSSGVDPECNNRNTEHVRI